VVAVLVRHARRHHRWTDPIVPSLLLAAGLVVGMLGEPVVRMLFGGG
jgi:hypothetical protein